MKRLTKPMALLTVCLAMRTGLAVGDERDNRLLTEEPCTVSTPSYQVLVDTLKSRLPADPRDTPFDERTFRRNTPESGYDLLVQKKVSCSRITYLSDGLKVTGFLVRPLLVTTAPIVIYNRGGNRAFGAIRLGNLIDFARLAAEGYVVAASQYRGNDGGEGAEEFGGADVRDVLNLIEIARALPGVSRDNLFMWGESRGGMMTYLALKQSAPVRAAAVIGAPADLEAGLKRRPEMDGEYAATIPDYASTRAERLHERSAIHWPEALSAPLLILQGGADWRVSPTDSLELASKLQWLGKPFELVIYEGDDHPLTKNRADAWTRMLAWFERFRR